MMPAGARDLNRPRLRFPAGPIADAHNGYPLARLVLEGGTTMTFIAETISEEYFDRTHLPPLMRPFTSVLLA